MCRLISDVMYWKISFHMVFNFACHLGQSFLYFACEYGTSTTWVWVLSQTCGITWQPFWLTHSSDHCTSNLNCSFNLSSSDDWRLFAPLIFTPLFCWSHMDTLLISCEVVEYRVAEMALHTRKSAFGNFVGLLLCETWKQGSEICSEVDGDNCVEWRSENCVPERFGEWRE